MDQPLLNDIPNDINDFGAIEEDEERINHQHDVSILLNSFACLREGALLFLDNVAPALRNFSTVFLAGLRQKVAGLIIGGIIAFMHESLDSMRLSDNEIVQKIGTCCILLLAECFMNSLLSSDVLDALLQTIRQDFDPNILVNQLILPL